MGQYYVIANTTKKQFINPRMFGEGIKLLEFGMSAGGTMTALAVLLANSNNRGGGDLHSDHPVIGSWANNRIVIAGDYAEPGDNGEKEGRTIYDLCKDENPEYTDISLKVLDALLDDEYFFDEFGEGVKKCKADNFDWLPKEARQVYHIKKSKKKKLDTVQTV